MVIVIAFSAVILVVVGTRLGPGLSPDSANYISGARNLAAGRGYVNYALQPITIFPPGFSVMLALGDRIGLDAVDGARWLNAFALGALVILTFMLARRHVRRVWLAVFAAAAVGFAQPLLAIFTFAWTEPVFCVLAVGLLLTLESLLIKRGRDPYLILLAGLFASVGFAYRYAGVTLLALSILIIGVATRRDVVAFARRAALCLVVASVFPVLIIARNLSRGSALGPRPASTTTVGKIVRNLFSTARGWVSTGRSLPLHLGDLALVGAVAVVVLGFVIAFRKYGFKCHAPGAAPLFPLAVYVGVYLVYIVVSELQTSIDAIDNRLLSPIFAPGAVLVAISVEQLFDLHWITSRRWVVRGSAALLVLWLVVSLGRAANRARADGESGQAYAARRSIQSDLAVAVHKLPSAGRVYSDTAGGLYFAGAKQPIYDSPLVSAFRQEVHRSPASIYLALKSPNSLYLAELRRNRLRVDLVTRTRDGSIYRVTRP
jgi:hypothetical protein